tara:strand:- start:4262 stop:4822 length:561 start_codon:yes stop_codon:yes gene_type:complete
MNSLEYLPNNIGNQITFKDVNNNLVLLNTSGLNTINQRITTDAPCSQALISATYNYVEQETKELTYENNSISLNLKLLFFQKYQIENQVEIDTNFVDAILIGKSNKFDNLDYGGLDLITNLRGKTLTNYSNNEYKNSFIFYNSLTIVDSLFTNVYSDINNEIFYTKEKGIVGFRDNGINFRYKSSE